MLNPSLLPILLSGADLFGQLLTSVKQEDQRRYEQKKQDLAIIADSRLRDQLAMEILLDRTLAPVEKAQFILQDAAKHAQFMAEMINYYHQDHGLTAEQASHMASQFRLIAIHLATVDSLAELKILYQTITLFTDQIASFKHSKHEFSIERSVRKKILNPLSSCLAHYANFQRRSEQSLP
ncbi:MAG: hypothetical protein OHK0012_22030 [Synechococcales cyanobacterium]